MERNIPRPELFPGLEMPTSGNKSVAQVQINRRVAVHHFVLPDRKQIDQSAWSRNTRLKAATIRPSEREVMFFIEPLNAAAHALLEHNRRCVPEFGLGLFNRAGDILVHFRQDMYLLVI